MGKRSKRKHVQSVSSGSSTQTVKATRLERDLITYIQINDDPGNPDKALAILRKNPKLGFSKPFEFYGEGPLNPLYFVAAIREDGAKRNEVAAALLARRANPFTRIEKGSQPGLTAIAMCLSFGQIDTVILMLERGVYTLEDLNYCNKRSFLHYLVHCYQPEQAELYHQAIRIAYQKGAEIDSSDVVNMTPLLSAALNRDEAASIALVTLLLELGADPNKVCELTGSPTETALLQAVIDKRIDLIKILLDHGAERKTENKALNNFFDRELSKCSSEIAELLGEKDEKLLLLCSQSNIDGLRKILDPSVDLEKLHNVCLGSRDLGKINVKGVPALSKIDKKEYVFAEVTLLYFSILQNLEDVALFLIKLGANVNFQLHGNGETALFHPINRKGEKNIALFRLLLSNQADPTVVVKNETPLSVILKEGYQDGLECLLEFHPNIFNDLSIPQRFCCVDIILDKVEVGDWDDVFMAMVMMELSIDQLHTFGRDFCSSLLSRRPERSEFDKLKHFNLSVEQFFKIDDNGLCPLAKAKFDRFLFVVNYFELKVGQLDPYVNKLKSIDDPDELIMNLIRRLEVLHRNLTQPVIVEVESSGEQAPNLDGDGIYTVSGRAHLKILGYLDQDIDELQKKSSDEDVSSQTAFFEAVMELPLWFDGTLDPESDFIVPIEGKNYYYYWLPEETFKGHDICAFKGGRPKMVRSQRGDEGLKPIDCRWKVNLKFNGEVQQGAVAYELKKHGTDDRLLAVDLVGGDGRSHLIVPCVYLKNGAHSEADKQKLQEDQTVDVEILSKPCFPEHSEEARECHSPRDR